MRTQKTGLTLQVTRQWGVHVVRLSGELVGEHAELVDAVTNLLNGPGVRIVLDMADVPFMSSTGLSDLVRINAQANVHEGRIILVNPSPFVAGVLQATQLDRFFEACPSVGEALARLG